MRNGIRCEISIELDIADHVCVSAMLAYHQNVIGMYALKSHELNCCCTVSPV